MAELTKTPRITKIGPRNTWKTNPMPPERKRKGEPDRWPPGNRKFAGFMTCSTRPYTAPAMTPIVPAMKAKRRGEPMPPLTGIVSKNPPGFVMTSFAVPMKSRSLSHGERAGREETDRPHLGQYEIGRASCRERV